MDIFKPREQGTYNLLYPNGHSAQERMVVRESYGVHHRFRHLDKREYEQGRWMGHTGNLVREREEHVAIYPHV